MSNRKSRRAQPKELQRNTKAINSLTPAQAKVMNLVVDERARELANNYIGNFESLIDSTMSAALIEYGIDFNDIEGIQKNMSELMIEYSKKSKKLEEGNHNMADIEKKVLVEVKDLLEKGISKKESIERLIYKFPKLSKSMLLNAYVKVKKEMGLTENRVSKEDVYAEFDRKSNSLDGEKMITHAIRTFGFTKSTAQSYYYKWKKEYMTGKSSNAPSVPSVQTIEKTMSQELEQNAKKIIETAKERQCVNQAVKSPVAEIKEEVGAIKMGGLKIIEEKVIKSVKVAGNNGIYVATTNKGIDLSKDDMTISFENEEHLNAWVSEVRAVFAMVI